MRELKAICEELGCDGVRTCLASGNAVFRSGRSAVEVKAALEHRLAKRAGRPAGVLVRTAAEMTDVAARNPFPNEAGNRTVALFVEEPSPPEALERVTGRREERLNLGRREIFIFYGAGMADSRLRIPAAKDGMVRNMNTVTALAEMAKR